MATTPSSSSSASSSSLFRCDACQMTFHDSLALSAHLSGKRHRETVGANDMQELVLRVRGGGPLDHHPQEDDGDAQLRIQAYQLSEVRALIERKRQEKEKYLGHSLAMSYDTAAFTQVAERDAGRAGPQHHAHRDAAAGGGVLSDTSGEVEPAFATVSLLGALQAFAEKQQPRRR